MNEERRAGWIRTLEGLRYDVTRRDPLQAHKEYAMRHVVDVTLDGSGQIRMVITRQVQDTQSETRKSRKGREYRVFVENHRSTIVNYRLQAADDLADVLNEMEKEIASRAGG